MNANIDIPRVLAAMKERGWTAQETCINCRLNNKTLKKILDGEVTRLDSIYRLCDGLKISIQEVVIAATFTQKKRPRLHVLPGGWKPDRIT